ncbi:polysaccharide deacetylase family protein [Thalassotalea sp. 1_MG-2023]|uniref:carbohydrate-binding protein n=1 Tax=Thalassotalea sp. 1_MG-2023 TaxID=3062680 RepID=UPI0026E4349D|nr:carbohydrate-binding protein [Thalassotalea sp. 1_MG-2023]MDO6427216.1 polysaccharide deacetylase family protein [Thalassotalea sp. 1_MG-2023]
MKFTNLACVIALACAATTATANDKKIYLTFDDGPMNATPALLDTLKAGGIKATFYINAWHLDGIGDENEDQALVALQQTLNDGHVVGNHSYDHMVHNCVDEFGPTSGADCNATGLHQINSYVDPVYDASMFAKNLTVLMQYLPNITSYPNYQAETLARLPYTNGWRSSQDLKADGLCATSDDFLPWEPGYVCDPDNPSNSSVAGIEVSNILSDQNYILHGWDLDWAPENWGIPFPANSLTEADTMLSYVDAALNACAPVTINPVNSKAHNFPCGDRLHADKVVILTHDFLFEDGKRGQGATKNLPKLAAFIQLAKAAGYEFDTMDNYAPQWQVGNSYTVGDYVTYNNVIYKADSTHTAQNDWAPASTPSLWLRNMPTSIWGENVSYQTGDLVKYMGTEYTVASDHVSQPNWAPNVTPALYTAQ